MRSGIVYDEGVLMNRIRKVSQCLEYLNSDQSKPFNPSEITSMKQLKSLLEVARGAKDMNMLSHILDSIENFICSATWNPSVSGKKHFKPIMKFKYTHDVHMQTVLGIRKNFALTILSRVPGACLMIAYVRSGLPIFGRTYIDVSSRQLAEVILSQTPIKLETTLKLIPVDCLGDAVELDQHPAVLRAARRMSVKINRRLERETDDCEYELLMRDINEYVNDLDN
jgi:hypothetical protein